MMRSQIARQCEMLAESDPNRYVKVSVAALRALEDGRHKPRRKTAGTLAATLTSSVEDLFPSGVDTGVRNPTGKTTIPSDRPSGGRPRRSSPPED